MVIAEIQRLAERNIQDYIFKHGSEDEKHLLLRNKEILGVQFQLIASQIATRRKAESKLPLFYQTKGIVYPRSFNLEQCSSEATAKFKAEIINREIRAVNLKIADLTGGFGIDSFFLSKKADTLDYIEPDLTLLKIAEHNHHLLGCSNIQYYQNNAITFLDDCKSKYDMIYLDPSRRDSNSIKIFRLAECEPNVNNLLPQIFELTKFVLIKASPLFDIRQGLTELTNVLKVIIVSVSNECKELLFLLQKGFSGEPIMETYNLDKPGNVKQFFSFTFDEERSTDSDFGEPQTYLYEPNASILKAGAFKIIGRKFELQKLHVSTHFYTSNLLKNNFPGRVFKVDRLEFDSKDFTEKKANVITRNYPLTAEELKKKLKLADGGDWYIIGFSSVKKKYVVLARRLAQSPTTNKSYKK